MLNQCFHVELPDATAGDVKSFAFQAIGLLASRLPNLFRHAFMLIALTCVKMAFMVIALSAWILCKILFYIREKIDMAVRLFNALKLEDQSIRLTIQESVTSLAIAYKVALLF